MKFKNLPVLIAVAMLTATIGCMDINPPVRNQSSNEQLLHSIHLPFKKAVYGVGDLDSLVVIGTLVTGDTFTVEPSSIKWRVNQTSLAVEIDTVKGIITALRSSSSLANDGITISVLYTLGETTKGDTANIYITDDTYNIQKFQLTSLDSARAGSLSNSYFILSLFQGQILNMSKVDLNVKDGEERIPSQFNIHRHVDYFLVDAETGKRFSQVKIAPLSFLLPIYAPGLYIFGNAPIGEYWLGMETYMYGKQLRDSIRFTQMPSAEVYFNAVDASTVPSVNANTSIAQPCAIVLMNNTSRDTISLDMPPADYDCAGKIPVPGGRLVIPPGSAIKLRILGYAAGSNVEWKAYVGSSSQREIAKGNIRSRLGK